MNHLSIALASSIVLFTAACSKENALSVEAASASADVALSGAPNGRSPGQRRTPSVAVTGTAGGVEVKTPGGAVAAPGTGAVVVTTPTASVNVDGKPGTTQVTTPTAAVTTTPTSVKANGVEVTGKKVKLPNGTTVNMP